jgi:hypothetical protein
MAGTSDSLSTSEELLLVDVRALVAQACKSRSEAERLIIEYANKGHFKRVRGTGGYIDPRHWGFCDPGLGFFIPVNFDTSTVEYVRLPADKATSYLLRQQMDELLQKDFYGPPHEAMRLVRLWRSEVLSMLTKAGLPWSLEPSGSKDEKTEDGAVPEHVKYDMPAPKSPEQKAIQAFVIKTYGSNWRSVSTRTIMTAARKDKEFTLLVQPFPDRSTFERALGRKKD